VNRADAPGRFRIRRWGRARLGRRFDLLLFLRPRQWPILSLQLAVGVLAAPAMAGTLVRWFAGATGESGVDGLRLFGAWFAWVVALNGGTLAFNSAYDRDGEDIAYLQAPPPPPRGLASGSLGLMIAGTVAAYAVHPWLGWLNAACVLLSVLYSHPAVRLKSRPGADLLVNMIGYGGGTTLAGLLVGQAACGADTVVPDSAGWWLVAGFALLFGSLYPSTQLYQLAEDRRRGDRTLTVALGETGSLALALALGVAAGAAFLIATRSWHGGWRPLGSLPVAIALLLWCGHLVGWLARAGRLSPRAQERGMYRALVLWAVLDVAILLSRFTAV
jgi:4-hydroxybenzoate polyprenyltransferase